MAGNLQFLSSDEPGKTPDLAELPLASIAINTHDGRLFIKKDDGVAESIIDVSAGSTDEAVTFIADGEGDAPGIDFNGTVLRHVSFNTIGAAGADGTGASGTWPIDISGNAATADSAASAAAVPWSGVSGTPTTLSGYGITDALGADHVHGNLTAAGKIGSTSGLPLITTTDGLVTTGSFGSSEGTFCEGDDSRLSDARTPTSHVHGNLGNDGKIGTDSGKPLITTTDGLVTTGSFGSSEGTFCEGDDSRLSDARTPTSHVHGNISNAGAIGSTSGLPLITTTDGVITTGSFGTTAGSFCAGDDARLAASGTTSNSVTFSNAGSGAASGSSFNGGAALTVSYDTIGAPKADGTGASGTWGISVTGSAASASAVPWSGVSSTPTTLSGYGITDAAASSHSHGSITSAGKIGSTSGLPLITGADGLISTGSFGSAAGTFCAGDDPRLSATGSVAFGLTLSNAGSGSASGTVFNGGSAVTISYDSIGAPKADGTGASGTWGISISGNAATATTASTASAVSWSGVSSTPTTLSGYGITDAAKADGTGATGTWGISITGSAASASAVPWSGVSGKPTTLAGYGITDAGGPYLYGYNYGVRGDGVTDSTTPLNNAATAAGPYGAVMMPPGTAYFSTTPSIDNILLEGSAATFNTSIPGVTDLTALGMSGRWYTMKLSTAGSAVAGSANQHLMAIQASAAVTGSTVNYQKNGLYVRALHNDPSDGTTTTRDLVAAAHMGYISATNTSGRLWATQSLVQITNGGDGLAYGHEIELYNYGTAQTTVGTTTSKYGLHLVAGAGTGTAAAWINRRSSNPGSVWDKGIYITDDAIASHAILYGAYKFAVNTSGFIGIGRDPGVQIDIEGATNARVRLTGDSTGNAYVTYVDKSTRAFTGGLDNTSAEWRLTGTEGLGSAMLIRAKTNGDLAFRGDAPVARPTVSGSRNGNAAIASLLTGLANQGLITDSTTNTIDTALLASDNALTGANTFTNSTGQTFRQAATQDGILLRGRAGGTGSYSVEIVPTTLSASRTLTAPNASGTIALADGTGASGTWGISITGSAASASAVPWSGVSGKPTTLAGYGITDAVPTNGTGASGTWGISISGNAATVTGGVYLSASNALTGANTFTNSTGQTFRQAATQDGILLRGRAGGTGSYSVEIVPTTLSASRTLTAPNASGTIALTDGTGASGSWGISVTGSSASCTGNAATVTNGAYVNASNAFTGANTFHNATGQTFGTATTTNDGIILAGRAGGTNSYRVTIVPGTLSASRTLTVPDVSGTIVTTGDTGSITNNMLNTITVAGKVNGSAITSGNISTSGSIATTSTLAVGQSSAAANTDLDLAGTYAQTIVAVAASSIDCSTGNYFTKTINGTTTFTVANVPASRSYCFVLELTHTSGTINWFSGVIWPNALAPTLTTGKVHLFFFHTDDGGTAWRASSLINYAS